MNDPSKTDSRDNKLAQSKDCFKTDPDEVLFRTNSSRETEIIDSKSHKFLGKQTSSYRI